MRNEFYNLHPSTEHCEIALAGIRKAAKQMRSKPRRNERLKCVTIGVTADTVTWGELGVCNAGDTSRSYAVINISGVTDGALTDLSARDLHLLMFGLPNAPEITAQLMCAMLWQRDCDESGAKPWNSVAVETHLHKVAEHIAIGVGILGHR